MLITARVRCSICRWSESALTHETLQRQVPGEAQTWISLTGSESRSWVCSVVFKLQIKHDIGLRILQAGIRIQQTESEWFKARMYRTPV